MEFFRPRGDELFRRAILLPELCRGTAPVRKIQVWLVHDTFPIPSPAESQLLTDGPNLPEEIAGLIVCSVPVVPEEVKRNAPLVL